MALKTENKRGIGIFFGKSVAKTSRYLYPHVLSIFFSPLSYSEDVLGNKCIFILLHSMKNRKHNWHSCFSSYESKKFVNG